MIKDTTLAFTLVLAISFCTFSYHSEFIKMSQAAYSPVNAFRSSMARTCLEKAATPACSLLVHCGNHQ
jgi:hypothetical protein